MDVNLILTSAIIRAVLGAFLAMVASFLGWFSAWIVLHEVTFTWAVFSITTVLAIGAWTGIAAALAWWHTESSRWVNLVAIVLILGGAMLSCWLGLVLGVSGDEFTWLGKGILIPQQGAAVVGSNLVAGILYLCRAIVRHQV